MREFLKETNYPHDGVQHVYEFPNGYGASVIKHDYSYGGKDGLWELAVLNFDLDREGALDYNTDITGDVIGYLSWKNVENYLQEIMEL
jgi:hypothetical protein